MATDNQTAKQMFVDHNTTTEGVGVAKGSGVSLVFTNCLTQTTVGASGSASALPTPVGYVEALIGGTVYKLAYFNV